MVQLINIKLSYKVVLTFIPNVWYHAVWSITDIGGGLSNWALYVNNQIYGILSATYFPPLVVRQNADLGRSGWVDSFWSGYVDNFAIYQTPVNSAQVALMYTAAMGPSGTAITCASTASTSSQIPASAIFFAAPFCTDPRQNTAIMSSPSLAQYSWLLHNTSNDAAGIHTGIIVLSGTTSQSGTNPQWIDLTTSTGAHSIGQTLGMLGGLGTGMISAGTVGWSFEVSVKSYVHLDWSKVFDLGDSSNQAYEIVIGWDGAASGYYGADVSLGSNAQTQDAFGAPVVVNTWYHIVWVIQYSLTNSSTSDLANYYLYVNGVLTNTFYSQNYPNYAQRVSSTLGLSNWNDPMFQGEIDLFNVYSIALTNQQVTGLYQASLLPGCVVQSSSSSSTASAQSPTLSSSSSSSRGSNNNQLSSSSSSSGSNNGGGGGGGGGNSNNAATNSHSGLTSGQLAGAIIGPILGVLLICCLIFVFFVSRRKGGWSKQRDTAHAAEAGSGAQSGEQSVVQEQSQTSQYAEDAGAHGVASGEDVEMTNMEN